MTVLETNQHVMFWEEINIYCKILMIHTDTMCDKIKVSKYYIRWHI